ncbi:hypothetical protein EYR36_005180 [Pleurotus pulmonarius]|nr:hypothetical protein EYR36_005180 [Pleurotus pulmonarius]
MDIFHDFFGDLHPHAEWNIYGANDAECEALFPDTALRSHGQHIDSQSILSPCLEGLEDLESGFAPRNELDSLGCHPDVLSQTAILPDTHAFEQDGVLWSPVQQLITTPSVDVPLSGNGEPALPTPAPITRPVVGTRGIRDASDRRRGPESAPKFVCHLCSSSFTAKHNLDCT